MAGEGHGHMMRENMQGRMKTPTGSTGAKTEHRQQTFWATAFFRVLRTDKIFMIKWEKWEFTNNLN